MEIMIDFTPQEKMPKEMINSFAELLGRTESSLRFPFDSYKIHSQIEGRELYFPHDTRKLKTQEHFEILSQALKSREIITSYNESDDEITLCWYDGDIRNSISIWTDTYEGVWSSAQHGKTLDVLDFEKLDDFLNFSV